MLDREIIFNGKNILGSDVDLNTLRAKIDRGEELDVEFPAFLRQLTAHMIEHPRTIEPALEIVFIAKSIERIGDHAKNIAEAVVQGARGKEMRHASAEEIRAEVAER